MKVTETIERECCQAKDLKKLGGDQQPTTMKWGRMPTFKFCMHCGRIHEAHSFRDPAGSLEWEYQPHKWPWEQQQTQKKDVA